MISESTLPMAAAAGLRTARAIHTYPTQADGIRLVADAYDLAHLASCGRGLAAARWWLRD